MAGLGKKVFEANEVLTAADVNGYLMDQAVMVFADSSARSSAIGTPSEGMMAFTEDTDTLSFYNGSSWKGINTPNLTSSTATAYTLDSADANTYVRLTNAGTVTVSTATDLPTGSQVTILADGTALEITTDGATIAGAGTAGTAVSFTVGAQYEAVSVLCVDTDTYRVIGNITAE